MSNRNGWKTKTRILLDILAIYKEISGGPYNYCFLNILEYGFSFYNNFYYLLFHVLMFINLKHLIGNMFVD